MTHTTDANDSTNTPTSSGPPPMRRIADPKTMRALTHPVRLALLEMLALEGPLTATAAGELIGESPTTCSFHFRQLAKYGFVEEAGAGPGRQRPWKIAHIGLTFSDVSDDAESTVAARSLERLVLERGLARLQRFLDTKSAFPKEWQKASDTFQFILFVTPEELEGLNGEILGLFSRFHARLEDATLRPEGSLPVDGLVFTYPTRLPGGVA